MNYATIKPRDIANGPGVRVSLFVSGCRHKCRNCFNKEAWDFSYGKPFDADTLEEILKALEPDYVSGFSLLGGEPFEPENTFELALLLKKIKSQFPQKSIWCYTGFVFDTELLKQNNPNSRKMLENIDVLVDGRFVEELKSPALIFRGSSNQRIIDVKASLNSGETVLLEGIWERKMGSGNIG
jgi:anaerobic ribonucleoside-triphosphate reductase activating protein